MNEYALLPVENEKQWRRKTAHVTIAIFTVAGNGDIDQRGLCGDGDDYCVDGVGTGTKSEKAEGMGQARQQTGT